MRAAQLRSSTRRAISLSLGRHACVALLVAANAGGACLFQNVSVSESILQTSRVAAQSFLNSRSAVLAITWCALHCLFTCAVTLSCFTVTQMHPSPNSIFTAATK